MKVKVHYFLVMVSVVLSSRLTLLAGFEPAVTYTVGTGPASVAAANVNGDGYVDLICANESDNTLTVLTNNGLGCANFGSATLSVSIQSATTPMPVPLTITPSGNQVTISWQSSATDFTLQTNSDLATDNWGDYAGAITNQALGWRQKGHF
jgi:hypothetical protein